jgi:cytoskeleton protein RodZ
MDKNKPTSNDELQEPVIEKIQSIGQILKAARIEKSLEVEQVSKQLNLSNHAIEQLEADNYDDLPEMAYVRGYIVLYCRLLGLESDEVLKNLNYEEQDGLKINRSLNISMNSQANNSKNGSTLLKAILTISAVVGVLWLYMHNNNSQTLSTITGEQKVTAPIISTDLDSTTKNAAKLNADEVPDAYSSVQGEQTDITASAESNVDEKLPVTAELKNLLEIEFNSISWVDVQDLNKKKIIYQSFPRGEKHKTKVKLPLNIFIDNAEGVVMRYEGQVIDLKSRIQDGGYAKFTLSE